MKLIAAVDKNWGIGRNNSLLVSIPEDMKFFRETTTGNVIIMGRKTLESFPGGKPLSKRDNIVITHDDKYKSKENELLSVVSSVEEAVEKSKEIIAADNDSQNNEKEIYVIGGASIYEQMLKYCDTAYITYIDYAYDADTYFPNLDESEEWELVDETEEHTYFNVEYYYRTYVRKNNK